MDDFKVGDRVLWTLSGIARVGTITTCDLSSHFYKFEIAIDNTFLSNGEQWKVRARESEITPMTKLMELIYG